MSGDANGFTSLLQKYMHRRNVSRKELAEALDIGPVIFKYVNGTRTVPNLKTVEAMAEYLQFTPSDKNKLIGFWRVEMYGPGRMKRWQEVDEFFRHFQTDRSFSTAFSIRMIPSRKADGSISFLHSDIDIQQAILMLLKNETQEEGKDSEAWCVMLADDRKMIECLGIAGHYMKNLKLHHFLKLPLNATAEEGKKGDIVSSKSLHLLQKVISLTLESPGYESRYFYSNNVEKERWPFASSFIVTHSEAVIFGEGNDTLCGIYTSDPTLVRYLRELVLDVDKDAFPFLKRVSSPAELLDTFYAGHDSDGEEILYSFSEQPCLCPYITAHMAEKYMHSDVPEGLKEKFLEDTSWYRGQQEGVHIREFSYLSGLKHFLDTGRMDEIPEELYEPFELSDRIAVLTEWFKDQQVSRQTRFLRDDHYSRSKLSIDVWKKVLTISFEDNEKERCTFSTHERDLIDGFADYFGHLGDERIYTAEESDYVIRNLLKDVQL